MRIRLLIVTITLVIYNGSWVSAKSFDPEIIAVTVDTLIPNNQGRVKITWKKNQDPDVIKYGIYYRIEQGMHNRCAFVNSIDTEYVHTLALAGLQSEGYSMASFSNDSSLTPVLVDFHFTVFLRAEDFNYCDKNIKLTWSNYIGWGNSLESYSIYRKNNNQPYELLTTIAAGGDTTYIESNVAYNSIYKYYIIANKNDGTQSLSNIVQIITEPVQSVSLDDFYLDTAIYNGSNVTFSFSAIDSDRIKKYNACYRENENALYKELQSIENTGNPRYRMVDDNPGDNGRFYNVSAFDLCDDSLGITNTIRQVVLEGSMSDNILTLTWNNGFDEIDEYFEIFMQVDDGTFTLHEQISANTNNSVQYDLTELSDGNSENFCFYVSANLSNGYYSQSNTLCFTITPVVDMPTAFTPNGDGTNDYIKPEIKYADITDYQFFVYDKYGGRIFETESSDMNWNGKIRNKYVKEGAYLYYIKFTTQWGHSYEKSGAINVIYP